MKDIFRPFIKEFKPDLLILFGSHAQNCPQAGSDLDIAIWKKKGISPIEWDAMMVSLMKHTKQNKIDLVDLGRQRNPLLQLEIYTKGKLLSESSAGLFSEKRCDAIGYYWDCKGFIEDQERVIQKKLASSFCSHV